MIDKPDERKRGKVGQTATTDGLSLQGTRLVEVLPVLQQRAPRRRTLYFGVAVVCCDACIRGHYDCPGPSDCSLDISQFVNMHMIS